MSNICTISTVILSLYTKYELRRAIECVNNQTHKADQIIIVDTSSDKETFEFVCSELDEDVIFITPYSEEKEINLQNRFELCQIALKYVSSEYVAFLDSKDIWNDDILNKYVMQLKSNNDIDMILSGVKIKSGKRDVISPSVFNEKHRSAMAILCFFDLVSSVMLKSSVALGLDEYNISNINMYEMDDILVDHYSEKYADPLKIEKEFWNSFFPEFVKYGIKNIAMEYCIRCFQKSAINRYSFIDFVNNIGLAIDEAASMLYGEPKIAKIDNSERENYVDTIKKKSANYDMMRSWLELKIRGDSISERLKKKGIKNMLIYGAGRHGKMLYSDIKNSDIDVLLWIDNSKEGKEDGIPIIHCDMLKTDSIKVDAIIVSVITDFQAICEKLKTILGTKCIPIYSLIEIIEG